MLGQVASKSLVASRRPFPWLTVGLFLYGALYFLSCVADSMYWLQAFRAGPINLVAGTIVKLEKSSGRYSTDYNVTYVYRDRAGREHRGTDSVAGSTWVMMSMGEPVRVAYLSGDAARSEITGLRTTSVKRNLLLAVLLLAVAGAIAWSRDAIGETQHVPLHLPPNAAPPEDAERIFRAHIKEHWPFSILMFGMGAGFFCLLLFVPIAPAPEDQEILPIAFFLPIAGLLMAIPFILHFRFYVRTSPTHLEARGFGPARRLAWRDMTDLWTHQTPQVEIAGRTGSLPLNLKFYSRDCAQTVNRYMHAWFKRSI
jgi:hypothetical protein